MGKTEIYLLRHGETEENKDHILQGHTGGHLSAEGKAQAADARERLKYIKFYKVLCSDLQRCMDTAAIATEGMDTPIEYTTLLRERDWGSATGMTVDGTYSKFDIPADAESLVAMKARARIFIDFAKKTYRGERILVVSHGMFLRCIQAVHLGVEMNDIVMMTNCEVRVIED